MNTPIYKLREIIQSNENHMKKLNSMFDQVFDKVNNNEISFDNEELKDILNQMTKLQKELEEFEEECDSLMEDALK